MFATPCQVGVRATKLMHTNEITTLRELVISYYSGYLSNRPGDLRKRMENIQFNQKEIQNNHHYFVSFFHSIGQWSGREIDASQAERLGRSCLSIACSALSLARSAQAKRSTKIDHQAGFQGFGGARAYCVTGPGSLGQDTYYYGPKYRHAGRREGKLIYRSAPGSPGICSRRIASYASLARLAYENIYFRVSRFPGDYPSSGVHQPICLSVFEPEIAPGKRSKGMPACEPLKSRWSPLSLGTRNLRKVTSSLSVSWIGIRYLGKGNGLMDAPSRKPVLQIFHHSRLGVRILAMCGQNDAQRFDFQTYLLQYELHKWRPEYNCDGYTNSAAIYR
ncbi:hypothetical protein EVAR_58803_1 [Eumeta japonica]|uniref:Uncharacterized protein n=1 Tax=Eumeta variegata TaxID=151549 RepID=A0A4C1YKX9_EUMVA|nr:hypothetical protein EVAR_58803_1 [Eumeta japonica]